MTNYVALSSDQNPIYQFFLPLTCAVWRERIGIEPLPVLVGDRHEWLRTLSGTIILHYLERKLGLMPIFVRAPEGYRTSNTAQIARMYAAFDYVIDNDDVVMTSDIDMWPIDRDWFLAHLPDPGKVTSYYANFPSRFPMCYVAANRATWFKLHGYRPGEIPVEQAVRLHMTRNLKPETAPADAWQHDEEYLTARIHALGSEYLQSVTRPPGDPFPDRIDRVNWPWPGYSLDGKKDAHLLRPAWHTNEKWPYTRALLEKLCPSIVGWANEYAALYRVLFGKE